MDKYFNSLLKDNETMIQKNILLSKFKNSGYLNDDPRLKQFYESRLF